METCAELGRQDQQTGSLACETVVCSTGHVVGWQCKEEREIIGVRYG